MKTIINIFSFLIYSTLLHSSEINQLDVVIICEKIDSDGSLSRIRMVKNKVFISSESTSKINLSKGYPELIAKNCVNIFEDGKNIVGTNTIGELNYKLPNRIRIINNSKNICLDIIFASNSENKMKIEKLLVTDLTHKSKGKTIISKISKIEDIGNVVIAEDE